MKRTKITNPPLAPNCEGCQGYGFYSFSDDPDTEVFCDECEGTGVAVVVLAEPKWPTFNHTRSDGPYDPCDICIKLMSKESLIDLIKVMRE